MVLRGIIKTKKANNHGDANFNSGAPYLSILLKPLNSASWSHQGGGHGDQTKERFVPDKSLSEAGDSVQCRQICRDGGADIWSSKVKKRLGEVEGTLWHLSVEIST